MVSSSPKIDEENNEGKKEENDEEKNEDKVKKPLLAESLIQQDEKKLINENSEKLYQKYKNSVQNEEGSGNSQGRDPHMEYIDRILIHDKKRIAENQKAKEQLGGAVERMHV